MSDEYRRNSDPTLHDENVYSIITYYIRLVAFYHLASAHLAWSVDPPSLQWMAATTGSSTKTMVTYIAVTMKAGENISRSCALATNNRGDRKVVE